MTEMTTIAMPRLTDQMEEAVIAKWLVEPGARVEVGDDLVEIETDKATMAFVSEAAGHAELLREEGDTVTVGAPIVRLHEAPVGAGKAAPSAEPNVSMPATAPASVPEGERAGTAATPLARRIAADLGVRLADVAGTGPRGRVLRGDVLRAVGHASEEPDAAPTSPAPTPSAPTPAVPPGPAGAPATGVQDGSGERRPLSTIQRTIARRMAEAKATVPHFQVACDVALDAALDARADLRAHLDDGERAPSVNDFIVRACALALREHELVNASFAGDHFELHPSVHVGIAVASEAGLLVATITDADRRSLLSIAEEGRRLAAGVRDGTATPGELTGATFTVSNLGMFGMTSIVPVINPPQAAILGVGAAREELYLREGVPTTRQIVSLTMSGDHRILNGADAARFLVDVKRLLEAPLLLLAR